jgi:alpha-tubulin suppressor-like RCC1 family protein
MPTFYNVNSRIDYLENYWNPLSMESRLVNTFVDPLGITPSLDTTIRSPNGTHPIKFTVTSTTFNCPRNLSTQFAPIITTTFRSFTVRISCLYKTSADWQTNNDAQLTLQNRDAGGSWSSYTTGGALPKITRNTEWTYVTGDITKNFGVTGSLGVYALTFVSPVSLSAVIGSSVWIADLTVTIDSDPTTTSSFDDLFVPADAFRSGGLWGWGENEDGSGIPLSLGNAISADSSTPVTTFSGGLNWRQVSCGFWNVAAIKTDGTLWMWGANRDFNSTESYLGINVIGAQRGRSTPVTTFAGGNTWKQVSCGDLQTAAIKTDGTLWVWGQVIESLVDPTVTKYYRTPVTTFVGGRDWKQIEVSYGHTVGIKIDGTLWGWGSNGAGQLSNSQTNVSFRITPVTTFAGGTNWADTATTNPEDLNTVSPGLAIKIDGTLWTWGSNTNGRLGIGSTSSQTWGYTNRYTPVTTFVGGTNWKQVSKSNSRSAAIKTDGTLWTWGDTSLGIQNTTLGYRDTPVTTFAGGTNWKQVSVGANLTAAIKTDGTLWTWGQTSLQGNLNVSGGNTPVTTFAGGTNWKQVSCGFNHAGAIKTDGTLWLWGNELNGKIGNNSGGSSTNISTPITTFAGGTNWKQVSCGWSHTAAIKTDGTLWVWGDNVDGELGNAREFQSVFTPITTFAGGTNWKQVVAMIEATVAIKTDGTLWTWGHNEDALLGNNVPPNTYLDQGSVKYFTQKTSTPITTFAGGTNWVQIGGDLTNSIVALKNVGLNQNELWVFGSGGGFGDNQSSYITAPINIFGGGSWKNVSCSEDGSTAAIKADGTLWFSGRNQLGTHGTGSFYHSFTPVTTFAGGTNWKQVSIIGTSSSGSQTAAIKTDGTLWVWGANVAFVGTLGIGVYPTSYDQSNFRSTPVTTFRGGNNWKQVSGRAGTMGAVKADGTLWMWGGRGFGGKLGNAESGGGGVSVPVTTFAGGTDWKQVSVGDDLTFAIRYTDSVL